MANLFDKLFRRQSGKSSPEQHTVEQHFAHKVEEIAHQRDETCHNIGGECREAARRSRREGNTTLDGISTAL